MGSPFRPNFRTSAPTARQTGGAGSTTSSSVVAAILGSSITPRGVSTPVYNRSVSLDLKGAVGGTGFFHDLDVLLESCNPETEDDMQRVFDNIRSEVKMSDILSVYKDKRVPRYLRTYLCGQLFKTFSAEERHVEIAEEVGSMKKQNTSMELKCYRLTSSVADSDKYTVEPDHEHFRPVNVARMLTAILAVQGEHGFEKDLKMFFRTFIQMAYRKESKATYVPAHLPSKNSGLPKKYVDEVLRLLQEQVRRDHQRAVNQTMIKSILRKKWTDALYEDRRTDRVRLPPFNRVEYYEVMQGKSSPLMNRSLPVNEKDGRDVVPSVVVPQITPIVKAAALSNFSRKGSRMEPLTAIERSALKRRRTSDDDKDVAIVDVDRDYPGNRYPKIDRQSIAISRKAVVCRRSAPLAANTRYAIPDARPDVVTDNGPPKLYAQEKQPNKYGSRDSSPSPLDSSLPPLEVNQFSEEEMMQNVDEDDDICITGTARSNRVRYYGV